MSNPIFPYFYKNGQNLEIFMKTFKKPTFLKNPGKLAFKKPKKPAGFLNGFFKWVKFNYQP